MKIAFLNIYGGRVFRGAEVAVYELTKRLVGEFKVTVFQSAKTSKRGPLARLQGVPLIKSISGIPAVSPNVSHNLILRLLKKVYLDPYSLNVLYFTLRCLPKLFAGKFDIIIPINGFWQIMVCKLVKLFRGGKIIVMGYAGVGYDDWLNLKLSPDAFFAMSNYAARWAKKVNSKVYVGVVPGGVDLARFNPSIKPQELPRPHPRILVVAALVPYKRVDLTIKAVARLNKSRDQSIINACSLVIVGNGPLREEIEALGKELLKDRFLRIDVSYDELPSIYTACDVFTLASMHEKGSLFEKLTGYRPSEAFGIVYVEAMASGLPVVAPDDELRREIIGKGGILVDCTGIDAYAEALKEALSGDWQDIPQRQAKMFEWDKGASKFSRQLNQLLSIRTY